MSRRRGRRERKGAGSRRGSGAAPASGPRPHWLSELARTRGAWVAGGLVALHLALCAALSDPRIHTGGDSVTYVLLAESVLEAGDGYALSLEPGPPQPHTKYPPGYPLLLAPLVAFFGRNFVVLKMLSAAFTAASVLLFVRYARRELRSERGPPLWPVVGLAFAVSPGVVDYSRWTLSEAPFLLFTLLALWLVGRDSPGAWRWRRGGTGSAGRKGGFGTPPDRAFWLALAAQVAVFYVRTIGALLLAAVSLSYLFRREWGRFLVHGAVGAGLTLPWLLRTRLVTGATTSYLEEFRLASVYDPEAGYLGAGGLAARFFENAWLYASRELPRALTGSDSSWADSPVAVAAALAVCALVLAHLAQALRRGPGPAELYFLLTCVAIMLFQTSVADVRYLVPLMPLVLIFAARGAALAAALVAGRTRKRGPKSARGPGRAAARAPAWLAAALAALALGAQAARVPSNVDLVARYHAGDPHAGRHPAWRGFFGAASWIAANTPEDAVVTVRKPRLLHALTDRRVLIYPFSTSADSVMRVVRESDYVIVDALFSTTQRFLVPALNRNSGELAVVHQEGNQARGEPVTLVLRVESGERTPGSP